MSSAPANAREIFTVAVEQYSSDQWPSYLDEACGDNLKLRKRVELLLEAHEGEESVLDSPAVTPPPTIAQPLTEKPDTQIGPYKLLQQIGEGGMGVVYMAEQLEPVKRRVALKIIKPGMDTRQVIARFEAERQALAMMDHPNIAKVLDAGATESGRPYFVMELVNGLPVTKYCDEQHLTPKERLELFVPICQAVQHAHQKGIIHRDLKPNNILVALYDGQPVPKVIDFGVAKATSQTLTEKTMFTQLGQVVGTLEYMSPEQAERNQLDIDTRSDIYSLGVVLYELLTGDTPFDRTRLRSAAFAEMLRIIREEEPPRPSTKLSSDAALPSIAANRHVEPQRLSVLVRGELDWIVMKSLEKDRGRRYETASKFAEDVQHFLDDEAVEACPPSIAYRFRKFARRHRPILALASAVVASLVLGLIGTAWQASRASAALDAMTVAHSNEQEQRIAARASAERAIQSARESRQLMETNQRLLYISDMNRAHHEWNEANIPHVLRLLERHLPKSGQDDYRSFEWRHFARQCLRGESARTLKLSSLTLCLAYSQDGRLLATGGDDGRVRIWDARNHELIHELSRRPKSIHAVAFSADGKLLATGARQGTAKLWDPRTGQLLRTLDKHPGLGGALALSPDGSILATNSYRTIKLWESSTGRLLGSLVGHANYVGDICFSPDGQSLFSRAGGVLVSPGDGGRIKIWDLTTRKERVTLPEQLGAHGPIALSPDGHLLVGGTRDGRVFVWDSSSDADEYQLRQIINGHTGAINAIAFSPDGKTLASGSLDRTAKTWDSATGRFIDVLKGHGASVHALAYAADGRSLATAGIDGKVKLWDLNSTPPPTELQANTHGHAALAISPDAKTIASSGSDQDIRVWTVANGQLQATFGGDTGWINSLAFSPNGEHVASVGTDSIVRLWNVRTGQQQATMTGHESEGLCVKFSSDGATLASVGADDVLILWDVETRRQKLRLTAPKARLVRFTADGESLAASSSDGELRLWDVSDGRLKMTVNGDEGDFYSLAIAPDGKTIAVGTDKRIFLWDLESESLLQKIEAHTGKITGLEFTPDGKALISGSRDQTVKIWDLVMYRCRTTINPRLGRVQQLALSGDGRTLAAAMAGSGKLKLWRAANEAELNSIFHPREVSTP